MNFDQLFKKYSSSAFLNNMLTFDNPDLIFNIHSNDYRANASFFSKSIISIGKELNIIDNEESNHISNGLFKNDQIQKNKDNKSDICNVRDYGKVDNDFDLNESLFKDDLLKEFELFESSNKLITSQKKILLKHNKSFDHSKWLCLSDGIIKSIEPIQSNLNKKLNKIEEISSFSNNYFTQFNLQSVLKIPVKYRSIFSNFEYFNLIQSKVFHSVFYTEKSLVVCSPTGTGKTVIFELAIVRLLFEQDCYSKKINQKGYTFKIVFIAPIKALCHERFQDWKVKFEPFQLFCLEVTGDSDEEYVKNFKDASIIFTTPEKWDSLTRRWRDLKSIMNSIRLILIDEIHILNDEIRGPIVEAVVSRMKIIEKCNDQITFRFIAVSATAPNSEDLAEWFSKDNMPAISFNLPEEYRTVKLEKIVLGFDCPDSFTNFKFDIILSYKLKNIINKYSENKPSLIFVSTRKSTLMTAETLFKETAYFWNNDHRNHLRIISNRITDTKLRTFLLKGIAFHHAGLELSDRQVIEKAFVEGQIPILISTSTLSMGVNLPAHLVIIKGTSQYISGICVEYTSTEIFQMIGRAGRPQFDKSATAIIMTKAKLKTKYENFLNRSQIVESNLHKHLAEHLNAEIVLKTITNTLVAMDWIRSTFFYIRVCKNQANYGLNATWNCQKIEQKVQDMCIKELNRLKKFGMIKMDLDENYIFPTEIGRLMAHYYTSLETMKKFVSLKENETFENLIELISSCDEIQKDVQLRMSERRSLNSLNEKLKSEKHKIVRFPLKGKIKNCNMKANCLIQATLGCLPIFESSLIQDAAKVMRSGQRLSKCLAELVLIEKKSFSSTLNAILLAKCFKAQLWENSKFVSRQLNKIGTVLSTTLVNCGLTSIESLENADSRIIEMLANRNPPFGKQIKDAIKCLPKYVIALTSLKKKQDEEKFDKTFQFTVKITLTNYQIIREKNSTVHSSILLIGDSRNQLIFSQRINYLHFSKNNGTWLKEISLKETNKVEKILIHLINEQFVGIDVSFEYDLLPKEISKGNQVLKRIPTSSVPFLFNSKKLKTD